MATWDDVRRIALELPETSERLSRGLCQWRVKDKGFVWERPLRRADLEALGDGAPDGPILGARVEHLVAKETLLADDPTVYFTTPTSTATRRSWFGWSESDSRIYTS
jgi:hypothetical protein